MNDLAPTQRRAINAATHMAYRPDIDGLRAVAVLPVVLNHAGIPGIWGGFVGVDIFFVISGYLITGILVRDLALGQHSIIEFYRRRVLRIFPALFVTLVVTTIVASIVMLPGELQRYASSLGATTLFGSNLLFWTETGYFEPAARLKPLLHTWSLAIEEQYYILWPLVLAAIGARRQRGMAVLAFAVTVVSLTYSIWQVSQDPSTAFYLLPSRAWELSLGAMLALLTWRPLARWMNEALGFAGLAAIAFAMRTYNEGTPFPGAAAVAPCLGAALLILTGNAGTVTGRLLSCGPIRFFGKISYSLYLIHWPVIVFGEVALFLPRTMSVMLGEVAVSILLATASWRYVERPFRSGVSGWPTPRVLMAGIAAMATTVLLAGLIWASGGFPGRFTPAQAQVAKFQDMNGDVLYRSGSCFEIAGGKFDPACLTIVAPGRPVLLLAGDSHGAHYWPGLGPHKQQVNILQATRTGCKPVRYPAGIGGGCEAFFRDLFSSWLPGHHVDRLMLAARWRPADAALVELTLRDPVVHAAHPLLVGPVPQYVTALPRLLVFADKRADPALPARSLDLQVFETDRLLRAVAARTGTPYLSMIDALCPNRQCRTWAAPGTPLQFDYGHLTGPGSQVAVDGAVWPALGMAR